MDSKQYAQEVKQEAYEAPAIVLESTISTRAGSPLANLVDPGLSSDIFDN